jgi:hypothetical protein
MRPLRLRLRDVWLEQLSHRDLPIPTPLDLTHENYRASMNTLREVQRVACRNAPHECCEPKRGPRSIHLL